MSDRPAPPTANLAAMATEQQPAGAEGQTCSPCRGTGRVISGLGGEPHQVTCPWCQGTGERIPGIDAQQAPAESGAAPDGAAETVAAAPDAAAPGSPPVT